MAEKFAHIKSHYIPFFSKSSWTKKEQTPPRCHNLEEWLSFRKKASGHADDAESHGLSSCATLTHHYYKRMVRTIPRKKNFKEMNLDVGLYHKLIERGKIVAFSNTREGEKKTILEKDESQPQNVQVYNSDATVNLSFNQ